MNLIINLIGTHFCLTLVIRINKIIFIVPINKESFYFVGEYLLPTFFLKYNFRKCIK